MKRHRMSRKKSRRNFRKHADLMHRKNSLDGGSLAMRGGIRL